MNNIIHTKFGNAKLMDNGYYRITTNGHYHLKYLHRIIWEDFYGVSVPEGYIVHHKNGNKLDNCILNLQLVSNKKHSSMHNLGENHPMYGKNHTRESRNKMSNSLKGRTIADEVKARISETETKNYARIVKGGFKNNKQVYIIKNGKKSIKSSQYPFKLLEWFKNGSNENMLILKDNGGCIHGCE